MCLRVAHSKIGWLPQRNAIEGVLLVGSQIQSFPLYLRSVSKRWVCNNRVLFVIPRDLNVGHQRIKGDESNALSWHQDA
jgi:hypothetical protein